MSTLSCNPILISILMALMGSNLSLASTSLPARHDKLVQNRIVQITDKLIGLPYKLSPLGEGKGIDPDPLIRYDLFDCTTFVETVGAMALAGTTQEKKVLPFLNEIRYWKGIPDFTERNHFISLDWIPNNSKKRLVADRTQQLWPEHSYTLYTEIDKKTWYLKNFGIQKSEPTVQAELKIVLIQDLINNPGLLQKMPQGAIISIVRNRPHIKEKIGTDLEVGHLGFAVWKDGQLMFRHAKGPKDGVVEEDFLEMLKSSFMADKYALNISEFVPQGR